MSDILNEPLYYLLTFLLTFFFILGIARYYGKQYRCALEGVSKRAGSSDSQSLTTKGRIGYITSLVLILFLFPGNLYLWAKMWQNRRVGGSRHLLKTRHIFYVINLSAALLLACSIYVLSTSAAIDRSMEYLDEEGFYLSSLDASRMSYIDSFLLRAKAVGLSEAKQSQILSATKDFEKYIFTYRTPTAITDQPYKTRYKDALEHSISRYMRPSDQGHEDKARFDEQGVTQEDLARILALLHYAPDDIFAVSAGHTYLEVSKIHAWGDEVIGAVLGEDVHILSQEQSLRENFFLVFRYRPLKFLIFLAPFLIITLLINTMLEKRYFKIIEHHLDTSPIDAKSSRREFERAMALLLVTALLFSIVYVVSNLGNYLDVTKRAKKADLIVSLGGSAERLHKALELYEHGYSNTGKILMTGHPTFISDRNDLQRHNKMTYLIKRGVPEEKLFYAENTDNTMMELLAIKVFMLKHDYRSVLIVADPPHSRRIVLMADLLAGLDDVGLMYSVISSGVTWWDKEHYYSNEHAVDFVMDELLKIPFNLLRYGVLNVNE